MRIFVIVFFIKISTLESKVLKGFWDGFVFYWNNTSTTLIQSNKQAEKSRYSLVATNSRTDLIKIRLKIIQNP